MQAPPITAIASHICQRPDGVICGNFATLVKYQAWYTYVGVCPPFWIEFIIYKLSGKPVTERPKA